jgi:hypothetical protein
MEATKTIESISRRANKESKTYYYLGIILFFVLTTIVISVFYFQTGNDSGYSMSKGNITFVVFSGSILVPIWFFILSKWKWKDYGMLRWFILFDWQRKGFHSTSHLLFLIVRVFGSFGLYIILIVFGGIFIGIKQPIFPGKLTGMLAVYYILVFFMAYGVIALPRMLAFKTKKHHLKYFYWLHFNKSLLVNSPLFMYVSLGLFVIISGMIVCLTFTKNENGSSFNVSNLLSMDQYGMTVSTVGIWLSILVIMANDFLKNYSQINKCYQDYTSYILRTKIIDGGYFNYVLVGIGNLGRVVGGSMIQQLLLLNNEYNNNPLALFECFVDRNLEFRVIPRSIVVIEKNQTLFEETRFDSDNGLTFGFVNGKDLISETGKGNTLPSGVALFCFNGDGGYLPILKLADFEKSRVIINTSSDADMGVKLKMIMDRERVDDHSKTPVLITTVEDSSIYSFLEENNQVTVFPLHASLSEGSSIGVRLFSMLLNIDIKVINSVLVILIGSGKTIYYTLAILSKLIKRKFGDEIARQILEKQIIVISDDPPLDKESLEYQTSNREFSHRYTWKIWIDKKEHFKVQLVFQDPTFIHPMLNAFDWGKENEQLLNLNELKREYIVAFSTRNSHDALRICQHTKQLANINNLDGIGVLASVAMEISQDIEGLLKNFKPLRFFLKKHRGFPSEIKDVILKKNQIIGNQIISISECLKIKSYYDCHLYSGKNSDKEVDKVTGEIALCILDHPSAYSKILAKLSGLSEPRSSFPGELLPTFYYNYTYTLRLSNNSLNDFFVFRGDAYLAEYLADGLNDTFLLNGYSLNGSPSFHKEIGLIMKENFKNMPIGKMSCGYNTRCPVSSGSNCDTQIEEICNGFSHTDDQCEYATVKIIANCDELPGALCLALSDFLMIGENMCFDNSNHMRSVNIVYENCSTCVTSGKSSSRLYVKRDDNVNNCDYEVIKSMNYKKQRMLSNRNIQGVKIKPVMYGKDSWKEYASKLQEYLEKISLRKFTFINTNEELIIIRSNVDEELKNYIICEL